MSHPLEDVIRNAEPFLIIGDSKEGRFPGMSFHSYTKTGTRFYCLDLGGLTESRGFTKGAKVYTEIEELPDDRGDLAIIWVKPRSAANAVDVAHRAGCKRVWFNYQTGHPAAVAKARELGMEVVEVGRCPVYYMEKQVPICRAHTTLVKLSGAYNLPPQTDATVRRREMI